MSWNQGREREAWRSQTRENSARLAWAWDTASSTGTGSSPIETAINFGLAFIEKPMFSYGCELLNRTDFEADDDLDPDPIVPQSTGFVYMWKIDARGLYVGAHVGVSVTSAGEVVDELIEMEHHFSFVGVAMKDVGSTEKLAD